MHSPNDLPWSRDGLTTIILFLSKDRLHTGAATRERDLEPRKSCGKQRWMFYSATREAFRAQRSAQCEKDTTLIITPRRSRGVMTIITLFSAGKSASVGGGRGKIEDARGR